MKHVQFLILSIFICFNLFAASSEEKGFAVAVKMEKANDGFIGDDAKTELILIDAHGTRTVRLMDSKVLEVPSDGDRSLSTFLNPQDVKGTKMLTWAHKNKDDDQWLYLPSLRRVKRISSRNKSSSFMGSEFTYEDLGGQEVEKYKYILLKDEKEQWILDRYPRQKSGYSHQIMTVSKKYMRPTKVEYFDRKREILKIGEFKKFKAFKLGKKTFWRSMEIHMKNVQTKKQSIFSWKNRKIGIKFPKRIFNKGSLK